MVAQERTLDRARRRGRQALLEVGDEIRSARLGGGLPLRTVSAAVGLSTSELSRIELGQAPNVPYSTLVVVAAAVGLDLPIRAFAAAGRLRKAAHMALIARFRAVLSEGIRWSGEVPIDRPGDQRAWDGVISAADRQAPVEAETRIRDAQALLRRIRLKLRDDRRPAVLLVVAGTRNNRQAVRLAGDEFAAAFRVSSSAALRSLQRGEIPDVSSLIFL